MNYYAGPGRGEGGGGGGVRERAVAPAIDVISDMNGLNSDLLNVLVHFKKWKLQ